MGSRHRSSAPVVVLASGCSTSLGAQHPSRPHSPLWSHCSGHSIVPRPPLLPPGLGAEGEPCLGAGS